MGREAARRWARGRHSLLQGAAALGLYAAGAILFFGRSVLLAPATTVVGDGG